MGFQMSLHGPKICQGSSQGDVQVHGQVRGDSDLPHSPRPVSRKDFLLFCCLFVLGLGGGPSLELDHASTLISFHVCC